MKLSDAELLAKTLIREFAPPGVWFEWSRRKNAFGDYRHSLRRIRLSNQLIPLCTPQEVQETIMHEIAHALTPGAGHGYAWQVQMLKFGLNPKRCKSIEADTSVLAKWKGVCATHGVVHTWARKPSRRYACKKCCKGRWKAEFELRVVAA